MNVVTLLGYVYKRHDSSVDNNGDREQKYIRIVTGDNWQLQPVGGHPLFRALSDGLEEIATYHSGNGGIF